jgi:transposase
MSERVFAWLMRSRRLVIRYEHKAEDFLAFLELACAIILLKPF